MAFAQRDLLMTSQICIAVLPPKSFLAAKLLLIAQAHDYIRALGECDHAITYPELAPAFHKNFPSSSDESYGSFLLMK
jgi:hypothetical protein